MKPDDKPDLPRYTQNMAIASTLSQVGCVTIVIVLGALLLGLWLDNQFGTRPILTIAILLGSIPVSLFALVRVALSTAARLQPPKNEGKADE